MKYLSEKLRRRVFFLTMAFVGPGNAIDMVEKFGGGSGIRFKIRNVKVNNGKDRVVMKRTGAIITVNISLELIHNCPECGGALNQIIVGLAGEEKAQQCIWQGMNNSSGIEARCSTDKGDSYAGCSRNTPEAAWEKKTFVIHVPEKPGQYAIRARYAQAYGCKMGALDWWKIDRPKGPEEKSTIAVVIVE